MKQTAKAHGLKPGDRITFHFSDADAEGTVVEVGRRIVIDFR